MPKKDNRKEPVCPICGGVIWGGGEKVMLEGAKIRVCQSCAQHGKRIVSRPKKSRRQYSSRSRTKTSTQASQSKPKYTPKTPSQDVVVVSNYADKIRNARNTKNLTQEKFAQQIQEKESLLRRIEAGKARPTIKLARKLEKALDISLLEQPDEFIVDTNKYMKRQKGGSSLGDIAFIKKKKE
ncbi:MAG: TIGR00270 family protein [Promethearchaeota archaeon]|nr:MAG: TIGR00270 family protein [Candidatus Lokiarchaeota archaeon]